MHCRIHLSSKILICKTIWRYNLIIEYFITTIYFQQCAFPPFLQYIIRILQPISIFKFKINQKCQIVSENAEILHDSPHPLKRLFNKFRFTQRPALRFRSNMNNVEYGYYNKAVCWILLYCRLASRQIVLNKIFLRPFCVVLLIHSLRLQQS